MLTYFLLLTAYCDHIWSWSLNPKPIVNSPPNLFNIMRLSSISLIATALAAIAGSVIAAPRPLHVRALEDINSLSERNVDVYSRESRLALLERRDSSSKPQEAADAAQVVFNKATEASFKARLIANHNGDHFHSKHRTQERQHRTDAIHYGSLASVHRSQIGKESIPSDQVFDATIAQYKEAIAEKDAAIANYDLHTAVNNHNRHVEAAVSLHNLSKGGR